MESTDSPFKIESFVSPEQLKKDVDFNIHDLDNAMMEHAGKFVHYAELSSAARRQYKRAKAAFEILESQLYAHWRETLTEGGKKSTEAQITAAVKTDPRWWSANQRLIEAEAQYDFANDAREAFLQRKDMIVQVSVDRRHEREGELRMRAATGGRDSVLEMLRGQQKP